LKEVHIGYSLRRNTPQGEVYSISRTYDATDFISLRYYAVALSYAFKVSGRCAH
jgi:hypothetical protein